MIEAESHPKHGDRSSGGDSVTTVLTACLDQQRTACLADPNPDFRQRKQDLLSLKRMVSDKQEAITVAIDKDYGNRSRHETLLAEIIVAIDGIKFTLKHLRRRMKTQRRKHDSQIEEISCC